MDTQISKGSSEYDELALFIHSRLNCCLFVHLLLDFGSLYCKQFEPRSGSSLIRAHSVSVHENIILESI